MYEDVSASICQAETRLGKREFVYPIYPYEQLAATRIPNVIMAVARPPLDNHIKFLSRIAGGPLVLGTREETAFDRLDKNLPMVSSSTILLL